MISEVESVVCFFLVTGFKADCLACSVDLICGNNRFHLLLFLVDGSEIEFDFLDGHVLSFRLKVPDLANIDVFGQKESSKRY